MKEKKDMAQRLKNIPLQVGVYIYKDRDNRVIYVGKARVLRKRIRSYFASPDKLDPKVRALMSRVHDFDYIVTATEVEALILESNLIKTHQPKYNIHLRDDKTYPYFKITGRDLYPRLQIVREKKDGHSRYFGPYTDVTTLRETLKLLKTVFPLRSCRNMGHHSRPCLNYHIGRCLAPCSGRVKKEDYALIVSQLIDFMEGNTRDLLRDREKEMQRAAHNLEFEKAARLRDQVQAIRKLAEKNKVAWENTYDLDIIAGTGAGNEHLVLLFKIRGGKMVGKDTYRLKNSCGEGEAEVLEFFIKHHYKEHPDIPREILTSCLPAEQKLLQEWLQEKTGRKIKIKAPLRGEKKSLLAMAQENARLLWEEQATSEEKTNKLLLHLARVLDLEVVPQRMECFDISHLGGEDTVASMVVFTRGIPDKAQYRRFSLPNHQNDDYGALKEAVGRRFKQSGLGNPAFLPEPDCLLIDGGLGQVNAVQGVLNSLGVDIPVLGLAKKQEVIYRPGMQSPLILPRRDQALMLLQRQRDEAHRFALDYNRKKRGRPLTASALDQIEGIGPKSKQALLKHFKSVQVIARATLEEIEAVEGINRKRARTVHEFFQGR